MDHCWDIRTAYIRAQRQRIEPEAPAATDRQVERLARAICRAFGFEPDARVLFDKYPPIGAKGHVVLRDDSDFGPATTVQWRLFTSEAIEVLRAMANEECDEVAAR